MLVLLDNHESHLYLPVIDFCREYGVVLLSFLPHCSYKLQPLDRSVYGPFKKFVNREMDQCMTTVTTGCCDLVGCHLGDTQGLE